MNCVVVLAAVLGLATSSALSAEPSRPQTTSFETPIRAEVTVWLRRADVDKLSAAAQRTLVLECGLDLRPKFNESTRQIDAEWLESTCARRALPCVDALRVPYRVDTDEAWFKRAVADRRQRSTRKRSNPFEEAEGENVHHGNDELEAFMVGVHARCQHIARVKVMGQSTLGTRLFVVRISDNPDVDEHDEPEFKYVGNMHGDEVVGRELLINLIRYLCVNYDSDVAVRDIVDNVDLWVMPSMNPDGYQQFQRANGNQVDLNRNFPDQYSFAGFHGEDRQPEFDYDNTNARYEPETRAMMRWSHARNFVLSANLHGGSVVANYPYDGNRDHRSGVDAATPDDPLFRFLATTYAKPNKEMFESREFSGGITNGARWYVLYGGMQDWNYLWTGDMELTIELSYEKWPDAAELNHFWFANKQSLLDYLNLVRTTGVRGLITDATTGKPIRHAMCHMNAVDGQPRPGHWFRSDSATGDYFRVLLPGEHSYTCHARGYTQVTQKVTIPRGQTEQLVRSFTMTPGDTTEGDDSTFMSSDDELSTL